MNTAAFVAAARERWARGRASADTPAAQPKWKQDNSFFGAGKQIERTLQLLADAIRARHMEGIREAVAPDYRGRPLGLDRLQPVFERDGVRRSLFRPGRETIHRGGAVAEWSRYVDGLETIEEVRLHIDRLERWRFRPSAVVRFELIGRPSGAPDSGIDRAYFHMTFSHGLQGFQIVEASLIQGDRITGDAPHFVEVGSQSGIAFRNRYYPAFLNQPLKFGMIRYGPGGISVADYDNNGLYDIFVPDGVESRLFRNRGDGTFEDVTAAAGLAGLDGVSVAIFADYDNDGWKDLFVSRTFQPNQLFHNNGDGTFTDVTREAGIGADSCTTVAAWADYNNDGYLDLYVGRYLDPRLDIPTTFYARNGEPNQLYRNNGDGTFTNVTDEAGVGDTGLCLGVVFGDYDDDGFPDLYVVNDFGRKTLYHNNGDGTFRDVTVRSATLAYGAGMSASFADYDNDGKLDIYCTNIRSECAWYAEAPTVARYMLNSLRQGVWRTDMPLYFEIWRQSGADLVGVFKQMASGNNLLRNRGDGTFQDVTRAAGANPVGWFWGASFADFDNDGWQDLYMADGWVYNDRDTEIELDFLNNVVTRQKTYKTGRFFDPAHFGSSSWHGWERNRHLLNLGDGTFLEIGRAAGTDLLTNSRGVAVADLWNRGALDIAVSASADRHALLKNQVGLGRNWLQVELVGTRSNRDAAGARITIWAAGRRQMREIVIGDGYGSQNTLRQHFGLGTATVVEQLLVQWPATGIVQQFEAVAANRIIEIVEGRPGLREKLYPSCL